MNPTAFTLITLFFFSATQLSAQNSDYKSIDATVEEVVEFLNSLKIDTWRVSLSKSFFYGSIGYYPTSYRVDEMTCRECGEYNKTEVLFRSDGSVRVKTAMCDMGDVFNKKEKFKIRHHAYELNLKDFYHNVVLVKEETLDCAWSKCQKFTIRLELVQPIELGWETSYMTKLAPGMLYKDIDAPPHALYINTTSRDRIPDTQSVTFVVEYNSNCLPECVEPERIARALQFFIWKSGGAEKEDSKF
ncbi:MAG: hypothetical protein H6601_12435 [Flavobacteriales bacterium]|nr:hypothetical protein [Flavobacteriales bacterium]